MKKILFIFLSLILWVSHAFSYAFDEDTYLQNSIQNFINSPSASEIENIQDPKQRYCEQVYLEASHRRSYTQQELSVCRDIFSIKNEDESNYMRYVLGERGV